MATAEALAAPEAVFSLLDAGHRVTALARSTDLPLRRLPIDVVTIPAPEVDAEAAVAATAELLDGPDRPDVTLPLDDVGLWLLDAALRRRPGSPVTPAGAVDDLARLALDKTIQLEAARAAGLDVPPTWVVRRASDIPDDLPLPAIVKPALAIDDRAGRVTKPDARYLTDAATVDRLRTELAEPGPPLLIQPLVAGVGRAVFGFATGDEVVAWSGHRRLRMMNPHGSGSSACRSEAPDDQLRSTVERFIRHVGWRGPFMVELLADEANRLWFMELNGRLWGSLALCRRQGFDHPAWAVAHALDPGFRPDPPPAPAAPIVQRHLGRELLHLLFVIRGPRSDFHRATWPRRLPTLASVLRPGRPSSFYNHHPRHRAYLWRDAMWTVRKALTR